MTRLLLSLIFSTLIASTAHANLCKQSLSLIKTSKNNVLAVSSQVVNQLVKARVLRSTSELDTAFTEQLAQAYHNQLESGKTQDQVSKIVITNMNVTPVAEINNGHALQLEHILAFEHAKKLSGLTTTSLYDEWQALESVDKKVFVFFNAGGKRKIKIKTRRIISNSDSKLIKFLFNFKVKMNARGFSDPHLILPRRSPKDTNEMVEYTWQLAKKMYDIRFASQFLLPSFYTIGTYPVISSNGAPHTPVSFDTRQSQLSYNAKSSLTSKNYMGFAFYQGQLFLSQFGKVFTKDYRNKVIGALAYHDALVYEMLSSLRTLNPNFMPLAKKDKWRMGGVRNHVYGLLSMAIPNPSPRLNRLGVHRVNQQDYNEVFNIYEASPVLNTSADYLAGKYNKKFGTKLNYKWAANNVGRMWFATFTALTLSYTPQIYAAGKTVNLPAIMEIVKVTPGAITDVVLDVWKGVDRNAESKAIDYAGKMQLWKIFDASINSVCSATENKQLLWDNYWSGNTGFFSSKEQTYVMAYKLLNNQNDFVGLSNSAIKQLNKVNKDLKERINHPETNETAKASHQQEIENNKERIDGLKQKIEASSNPEFIQSLEMYLEHYQAMEADSLAKLRDASGNVSEADFVDQLEIILNGQ